MSYFDPASPLILLTPFYFDMAFRIMLATVFLPWCDSMMHSQEGAVVQPIAGASSAALPDPGPDLLLIEDEPGVEETLHLGENSGLNYVNVKSQAGGLYAEERRLAERIPEHQRLSSATGGSLNDLAAVNAEHTFAVDALQVALARLHPTARIDESTPRDGHCLLHALRTGGLLEGIPEGLTVSELRRMALTQATEEQLENAAISTGQTVAKYITKMKASQWGDELMLRMLSSIFARSISIISASAVVTFYPSGADIVRELPLVVYADAPQFLEPAEDLEECEAASGHD